MRSHPGQRRDGPAGIKLLADEPDGLDVLADSAYGSGDSLAALADGEHRILIKPWPLARNKKLADDQFNRDDFAIDYTARTVTCPNGITVRITDRGNATFGTKCRDCPVRTRCTSAVDGKIFIVSAHDHHLAANRARWRTDTDLVADYRQHRPMVERTIAWLVTNGHRRCRHHGVERNRLAFSTRAAVVNLKRLINLGLEHDGNTWNLAPTSRASGSGQPASERHLEHESLPARPDHTPTPDLPSDHAPDPPPARRLSTKPIVQQSPSETRLR